MKSNFAHRMRKIPFQNLPWGNFFDVYLSTTVYIDTKKYYFTLINHSKIKVFASVTYCFLFRYSITVYIATRKVVLALVFTSKSDIFLKGNISFFPLLYIQIHKNVHKWLKIKQNQDFLFRDIQIVVFFSLISSLNFGSESLINQALHAVGQSSVPTKKRTFSSPSYIPLTTTAETIDFVGFSQVKNSQVSQKMC